ncbi:MAG: glycine cleavage system protein H [Candidatus Woesearchaeota archaeon]
MRIPNDLKYNKDYTWAKIEGDTATIGVVEPAASKVKEFVFIQLPEKGKRIKQGETYVSVEAVKWSGHLSSPVSGEIIEVNDTLFDEPSKINEDPYKHWVMKVKMEDPKEQERLLSPEEAKKTYERTIGGS